MSRRAIHKLLFVTDAPADGGAEQYIASMATAAKEGGMAPTVCWIRGQELRLQAVRPLGYGTCSLTASLSDRLTLPGVPVHAIPAERTGNPVALWREFNGLLQREQPEAAIINAAGRPRFWLTAWACRRNGVPCAWVHHMIDQADYRRLAPHRLGGRVDGLHLWRLPQALRHRLAATAATTIIALNDHDRFHIARDQGVPLSKIAIVPNGIDTARHRFNAEARREVRACWMHSRPRLGPCEAFIVGTAGRLVSGKGIPLLIEAAAALRQRQVPVFVVVAGDGPERDVLASTAARLGIADSVLFLGFVRDMAAFYSGLDAFALCSNTESFGLVLAEAHACERAVIATPTAGACTQIEHHVDGILLNSYTPTELAEELFNLYRQPAWRDQLGRNGHDRVVRDFSIERTLDRTLQLLRPEERRLGCGLLGHRYHRLQPDSLQPNSLRGESA